MTEQEAKEIEEHYINEIKKGNCKFKQVSSGDIYTLQGVKYDKEKLPPDVNFTLRRLPYLDNEHTVNYEYFKVSYLQE